MAPAPVGVLLPAARLRVLAIVLVLLSEVPAIRAVFVVIPVVVVLVRAITDAGISLVVAVVVLCRGVRSNCYGRSECSA